jgi:hypothetical protein
VLSLLVGSGWFYGWWFFKRTSKIALGKMVWSSFKCLLALDSAWIWNLSIVFRWDPFLWHCIICMTSFIGPKDWAVSLRCLAKL